MNINMLKNAAKSLYPTMPIVEAIDYIQAYYNGIASTVPPNREFNPILNTLCNPPFSILSIEWQFADPDSGESYVLSAEEAAEAFRTGVYIHPETDEVVPEVERRIFKNYLTTELFDRIIETP